MHVSRQKKRWHGGAERTVWVIDTTEHGRRVCVTSTEGRQDCLKRYRQKIREIEAQEAAEEARRGGLTRFGDELIAWFGRYKTGGTGATVTSDRALMKQIKAALGRYKVKEITRDRIQDWLRAMERDELAVSTRRRRFFMVRQFFRQWYADAPGQDPTRGIKTPTTRARGKEPPAALDDDQMTKLTAYLLEPGTLHGGALAVMLWHFLRAGELMGLKPADLDGDRLHIRRQITWQKEPGHAGTWTESAPKYGSARTLPIMKPARDALTAAAKRAETAGDTYLYHGRALPHLTPHALRIALTHALAACGLPYIRVHDLRHSGISYMIRHGVPVEAVSQWAGHASVTVTLSVYYQVVPAQITAAEKIAADLFSGPAK